MAVVRGDFSAMLAPGARKAFASEYDMLPAEYTTLFNINTSSRAFEDDLFSTGLGTAASKPEGEEIASDRPYFRASVRYTHLGFGLGYEVTQEAVEDELYGAIVPPASRFLANAMNDAEEVHAAAVLNNAFSSQTSYDGVSLFNVAHTTVGAGTQANKPATDVDLSVAGLQASLERFMNLKDDRGLRIRMMPSRLVSGPAQHWIMQEITESQFKPFTANNEINTLQGILTPFVYRYLTDTDMWFVQASDHDLNFFWRRQPRFKNTFDDDAEVAKFSTTARFVAGVGEWRGLDGSSGA